MFPSRADKRKAAEMSSSDQRKNQQWKNQLLMEPTEPVPLNTHSFFKDFQKKYMQAHKDEELSDRPSVAGQYGQHDRIQFKQRARPGLTAPLSQLDVKGLQPGETRCLTGHSELQAQAVYCDQANFGQAQFEPIYPEQYMHEDYIYVSATPFALMQPTDQDAEMTDDSASEQYSLYCPCGINRSQLVTICCTGRDCDDSTKIEEMQMGPPEEKRARTTDDDQFKF